MSRQAVIDARQIDRLIEALRRRGFRVIGPQVRDGAIVYDEIRSKNDLPAGWTDEQEAGRYRLKRRGDGALFGYAVGPQSWKKYLHPAEVRLFTAQRAGAEFHIVADQQPRPGPFAFLGVRACELAAMGVLDRVLAQDHFADPVYRRQREGVFVVAVNCTSAAATCFCVSVGTGPQVRSGFDLALTELLEGARHDFLIETGSHAGEAILQELEAAPATPELLERARAAQQRATAQSRSLPGQGLRELLYANLDHPHWDDVARRCLSCANCTLVCPTCFCTTLEEVTDITGQHAERWRKWDSCFSVQFSYIHGGSVRSSAKSRYRQWLTHKLATWIDQFGSSGCVGCGRCISWCPVGIDLTGEVARFRQAPAISPPQEQPHGAA
jgi:ferredoxin